MVSDNDIDSSKAFFLLCACYVWCVFRSASLLGSLLLLLGRESMPLTKLDLSLSSLRSITIPATLCPSLVSPPYMMIWCRSLWSYNCLSTVLLSVFTSVWMNALYICKIKVYWESLGDAPKYVYYYMMFFKILWFLNLFNDPWSEWLRLKNIWISFLLSFSKSI